jgi:Ca2+-binding RTX toxin-like protein
MPPTRSAASPATTRWRDRGGNDVLNGGLGADVMDGGAGNDDYSVDNAGDVVIEAAGEGFDTVRSSIDYTLTANVERLVLTGGPAIDGTGNDLNNDIVGNNAANELNGLGGNDTLQGRGGDDILVGGDGNDVLNGGLGSDDLLGSDGDDTFVFNTALDGSVDIVVDFDPAADTFHLDDAVFTGLATGALAAEAFNDGGAVDADDRILYDTGTGALSFDADGSGAIDAIQFATVANFAALSSADFLVV